eukprot:84882-Amphidinium_carterae.1
MGLFRGLHLQLFKIGHVAPQDRLPTWKGLRIQRVGGGKGTCQPSEKSTGRKDPANKAALSKVSRACWEAEGIASKPSRDKV